MVAAIPVTAAVLDQRIARSSDDAEENSKNRVNLGSSQLNFGGGSLDVGVRWSGLAIPVGASITTAYVQFTASQLQGQSASFTLRGQAADNAATFSTNNRDLSNRPRTGAAVAWSPGLWTAGVDQRTPDLSAVIQEIVNRPGWASGNAIALLVTGAGNRSAWSYDGSRARAPLLHLEFTIPERPPTAKLTVVQSPSPAFTVTADGSASADPDSTPIARYDFDFGDGGPVVATYPPTAKAQHTYGAAGTYTVTLIATDTGGSASSPASVAITVRDQPPAGSVAVYAGYYDTHHVNSQPKPDPWRGSPNVVFTGNPDAGTTNSWDTSTIRVDNLGGSALSGVAVAVDIGTHHYALWGAQTIQAGYSLILAQTAVENFDGSDTNPAGCFSCSPNMCLSTVSSTVPVVHVTVGGVTTDYYDPGQVLNTHGVDAAGCPYTGTRNDESQSWQQIFPRSAPSVIAGDDGTAPAGASPLARRFALDPPWPNPVHGAILLRFSIPASGAVHLGVFDVSGRMVRTCVDGALEAGDYQNEFTLPGANPGMYFALLSTPEGTLRRSFVLLR